MTKLTSLRFVGEFCRPSNFSQVRGRDSDSHIEMAEQRVDGADFVEAHFVDQLLEDQRIVGKQIDAPLPVVETDGAA